MELKDIRVVLENAKLDLSSMDRPRLEALCNALVQSLLAIYPTLEEETGQASLIAEQATIIQTMGKHLETLNKTASRLARRTTLDDAVRAAEAARREAEGEAITHGTTLTEILDRARMIRQVGEPDYPTFVDQVIALIDEASGVVEEDPDEPDEPVMAHLPYCSVPGDIAPEDCPMCAAIPPSRRQEIIDQWEEEQTGGASPPVADGLDDPSADSTSDGEVEEDLITEGSEMEEADA